ncbi:MAG: replication initiator protein A [Fusobacterium sp.]|uniref:replication initiator protein A n=1 Tax=Fusobacterium sp. TaxID=68766 RepID=UPI0026DC7DD2|nr:replication initiator protein A [Fusobacterium sp.]MDO4690092.1 replication initiator protein A [Fusobacterium sp.]
MKKKSVDILDENLEKSKKKNKNSIEIDNFEVSKTGSLADDILDFNRVKNVEIEENELPEIELQEILIRDTGNYLNLKENYINIPVEMIVFPFFTPQKQNKRVNFKYNFQDLGVIMHSTLISKDKNDKVFQPSIFEEKIYMFLISMYLDRKDKSEEETVIEFEISDFIVNFLGNKMNRTYYSKVEQALKNLKNTQYQFEISNHTKFGENKFEDKEFKLLTYQKLKIGKKIFYKVYLDKNIVNKIKSKRYIKYNTKNLLEIMTRDPIASRIYKYISKIRYRAAGGDINVRTIAAIIPLKIEQSTFRETKSGVKVYILSRMKPVLTRILKAFDVLVEMNYIKYYEERFVREEDTYYISYVFNKERDGDCHTSEFINKSKEKSVYKENLDGNEEIIDLDEEVNYNDKIEDLIERVKENPKIYSKWNKRADNKIEDILKKDGESVLRRVLCILIDLDKDISSTLVKDINSILKTIKKAKKKGNPNLSLFENVSKGKGLKDKAQINQARKRYIDKFGGTNIIKENSIDSYTVKNKMKSKFTYELENKVTNKIENEKEIREILKDFDELTRIEIEEKALEIMIKNSKTTKEFMKELKKTSEEVYYKMISNDIKNIIKENY